VYDSTHAMSFSFTDLP